MTGVFGRHLRSPCIDGRHVARDNKACRKRWIHSLDPNLRKGINGGALPLDSALTFSPRPVDH